VLLLLLSLLASCDLFASVGNSLLPQNSYRVPDADSPVALRQGKMLIVPDENESRRLAGFDMEARRVAWYSELLPRYVQIAAADGRVYLYPDVCGPGDDKELVTLDADSGSTLYRLDVSAVGCAEKESGLMAPAGGYLYVVLEGAQQVAVFEQANGETRYLRTLQLPDEAGSGSDRQLLDVAGLPDGGLLLSLRNDDALADLPEVYRLGPDGQVVWSNQLDLYDGPDYIRANAGELIVDGGVVHVIEGAQVRSFRLEGGARIGECGFASATSGIAAYAAGSGEMVAIGDGSYDKLVIFVFDPDGGDRRCRSAAYQGFASFPVRLRGVIVGGVAYLPTGGGPMALDAANGAVLSIPPSDLSYGEAKLLTSYGGSLWALYGGYAYEFKPLR
jgi:outer membrane protein assembly factor BamB